MQAAGISSGKDVYDVIYAGAEATGSSSGIIRAPDSAAMVDEMIHAVREAWDDREKSMQHNERLFVPAEPKRESPLSL